MRAASDPIWRRTGSSCQSYGTGSAGDRWRLSTVWYQQPKVKMGWQRLERSHLFKKQKQNPQRTNKTKKQNSPQQDLKTQQRSAPPPPPHTPLKTHCAPSVSTSFSDFTQREPKHHSFYTGQGKGRSPAYEEAGHTDPSPARAIRYPGFSLPLNKG